MTSAGGQTENIDLIRACIEELTSGKLQQILNAAAMIASTFVELDDYEKYGLPGGNVQDVDDGIRRLLVGTMRENAQMILRDQPRMKRALDDVMELLGES